MVNRIEIYHLHKICHEIFKNYIMLMIINQQFKKIKKKIQKHKNN